MPSAPEGSAIARARILREQERRTGTLDLGDLGLTEWPNELWELNHLSCLNLGVGWTDAANGFHPASPGIPYAPNTLPPAAARELWNRLPNLQILSLAGARGDGSAWDDLAGLESLPQLRVLDLSWTSVEDLAPLASLTYLEVLDASYTFLSDIRPLARLSALRHLDLSHTKVADLAPLQDHPALQVLLCYHTPVTTVAPLSGLPALRKLDLTQTQVTDLEPLITLPALETLLCAWTPVETIPESLVRLASSAPHPPTGQTPPP
ncbi:leucine-rich repeat domain-containing protein [Brevifollis gellanilyticus]|uniref:Leucine-rich repeat domain-containing protein n=1 Tax=Brevifollis gellanilyticus TaxID=748831 RepID=A0A512MH32_9BACT|nr:leucine-rich repeat domain-containing protein [Brevifollis gellanilyticus]GEP45661.1 hypothetical protein BGE01nite_49520 [Brevifollis gellanilyticus]